MASPSPSNAPPPLLLTPKPEPLDNEAVVGISGHLLLPNPANNSQMISPEILDPVVEEYIRLANQYLAAFGGKEQNAMAMTLFAEGGEAREAQPKRKKPRGDAMVRVPDLTPMDYLHYRNRVRQTRLSYESLRSFFCLKYLADHANSDPSSSKPRNRADLKASRKMRQKGLFLHNEKDLRIVGNIPGVNVGDIFFYRAELMVLGLHNQIQGGIGFVPASLVQEGVPICTSIVASGGYQDDQELSDDVIMYTGSGGRIKNQTHVSSDQSLQRGNLSLERSMQFGIEIRVIRGLTVISNPLKKVYIYDGLFRVIECKKDKGKSGCNVYLFKLVRVRGQSESGLRGIRVSEEIKRKLKEKIVPNGYVSVDISNGVETVPVPFFNDIDEEMYPLMFEYVKSPNYPSLVKPFKGCLCKGVCNDNSCDCVKRNNGQLAYDSNGILMRGRPIVYECGDTCQCPIGCPNRVTQNGVKLQMEVFRSSGNIWGVRSLDFIQAGSFICEFSGDLVEPGLETGLDPNRVLIDPKSFPQRWREFGDVSSVFPGLINDPVLVQETEYLLDVSRRRNVSCYVSHSSSPNVFVQYVLYGHDCVRFPRMMVFAMENIPPLRELSLDYGV
ncbi:hypothetical protein LUZ60_012223 [Juncus effusus]|nr:hypothetical protein LUZ60_012223 [Juncus effusus]